MIGGQQLELGIKDGFFWHNKVSGRVSGFRTFALTSELATLNCRQTTATGFYA
jgi:hypothetical protein